MRDLFIDYPDKTCIIYRNDKVIFTSEYRGVRPMMEYMKSYGPSQEPLTIIDRIMGKGAVLLAVLIGATNIKTPIISEPALALALKHKHQVEYGKKIPFVINRTGDGRCPIESSILDIDDIEEGYEVIKVTIAELMKVSMKE